MKKYTIYCTNEQTKKACELGAPIEYAMIKDVPYTTIIDHVLFRTPTAEQMIGWLEEQDSIFEISINYLFSSWSYSLYIEKYISETKENGFATRKAATLAAIDAALEKINEKLK